MQADTNIIIVAAGSGSRFGGPLPKQFCDLGGRPVLMHTIDAFRSALPSAQIVLVLSAAGKELWTALCLRHSYDSPAVVEGGASRYESVCNAIKELDTNREFVMVHDGARPFPPATLLKDYKRLFADVDTSGIIPVVPVTDSLRRVTKDANKAVDRAEFRAVQTPQIFRTADFIKAYTSADGKDSRLFTDDASVIDSWGGTLMLADGAPSNIKITNPGDLALAEFILKNS